jgi:AcrR family transcriptional regulator
MDDLHEHKIMSMEPEKRERVLNAAMHEFGSKGGYKSASTDAIVREAGISKGLLFHYFGCKEKLYEFLKAYAIDVISKEYTGLFNFENRDAISAMWQAIMLKMDLSYKYPNIFDFMTAAYMNDSGELSTAFNPVRDTMFAKLLENCDKSLFRDDVDVEKAVNIIRWTITGYSDSQMLDRSSSIRDYQKQYERYLSEIEEYFTMFRKLFYKA